jgi:hypothetical protein
VARTLTMNSRATPRSFKLLGADIRYDVR